MHLRTKLTLGILLATLATFAAIAYLAIPDAKLALRDRIDDRLRADLPAIRDAVVGPGGRIRPEALDSFAHALVLVGPSGADVLATSDPPYPPPDLSRVTDLPGPGEVAYAEANDGSKYRYATIEIGESRYLAVAAPVDDLGELVDELIRSFSLFGVGGGALLALLSWWWIRHSTRPIERLTQRAGEIAQGDADRTLSVPASTTELRDLTRALDSMIASVDASLAARIESESRLREFVANASHELRTPLTSVSGYLQLDLDGALEDDEHHRRAIGRALAEAARMRRIVADLQLLTELDENLTPLTTNVDVAQLAHEAVVDAEALDPTRTWILDAPDEPLVVRADPDQLRQVLVNLLDNVRVHTPPATTTTVTAGRRDDTIVLEVSDDGPGVPDDHLPRVFDRFWRHEPSRSRASGGSGLGLSIAAAIVAAQHGTIEAPDAPNGGFSVRVALPATTGAPRSMVDSASA
jgi:two-component system, OmpR family, sensor kinase